MLEICTYDELGHSIKHDLHALKLADGRLAHTLTGHELYRELRRIGVDDVTANMGLQDLLLQFSKHLKAQPPKPDPGPTSADRADREQWEKRNIAHKVEITSMKHFGG